MEVEKLKLKPRERDYLTVTLAHAYRGIGDVAQGISILEKLQSSATNVVEAFAELYYVIDTPDKTIEILTDRKSLTVNMAFWLNKSYFSLSQVEKAIDVLEQFKNNPKIKKLYEEIVTERQQEEKEKEMPKSNKVWVVHGRDEGLRRGIFDFLRALGLEPIEWVQALQLTRKGSPYTGETLDVAFQEAQAVVVLLTGDDEVKLKEKYVRTDDPDYEKILPPQPRPNVLFEAGMAFGRNPERTILVQVGNPKPFSDVAGRHMLKLNNSREKRHEFTLRLQTAGCHVNISGVDWLSTGNFEISE